jgi:hypothetical protein
MTETRFVDVFDNAGALALANPEPGNNGYEITHSKSPTAVIPAKA